MTHYRYTARDNSGAAVTGTLQAASLAEVTQQLRAAGQYPTKIERADEAAPLVRAAKGICVSRKDVISLIQQLAIMTDTGVTLAEALDCVGAQANKPNVASLVADLTQHVQGGNDFSGALGRHPKSFPRLFTALIRAAEKSGMFSKLMNRGMAYLRDEQEIVRRVRGALIYPCIMLIFAISTTLFLLTFVLPKFTVIYASKKAALPLPTKMLIGLSSFICTNWIALLAGVVSIVVGFVAVRATAGGKRWMDRIQLRLPVLGGLFKTLYLARGLRMVGTMAGSGVNLVECVDVAQQLSGNVCFQQMWSEVATHITAGRQMSEPLAASPLVPRTITQMIRSAERGGKLAVVAEQVAGFAEQELKERIAELTRYIEPVMIVIMGVIIGSVALALMLPIFTISRVIAQ